MLIGMAFWFRVAGDAIRKGQIKAADLERLVQARHSMKQVPFYIDDTGALTIGALRTRARRMKRRHGIDLLIVDYLQLLQGTGSRQAEGSRVVEVSEITRDLKAIGKELDIPVLALSQLSRAVESREDKHPQLSDLRESGSIEQDSDVVMFIYREEYYLSRSEPNTADYDRHLQWSESMAKARNLAELIVAKQRNGPVGNIKLHFDGQFTKFSDLEYLK